MPEQVLMPRLSDTMTEGTVSKWLKRQGDDVKKGEPLVEIETDKANIELEAYASGKLARIVLQEGQSASVGEVLALSRMQQTIARRMVEAKGPVPHFYVSMEVDMARALANVEDLNEGVAKEEQVTINDLILRACALSLRDYPDVNSSYQNGKL